MRNMQYLFKLYFGSLKNISFNIQLFIAVLVVGASMFLPGQFAICQEPVNSREQSIHAGPANGYSSNLVAENLDNGWVILRWTAPGDDGYVGQASYYDLRYQDSSLGPIDTDSEWQSAIQVINEPSPAPAGELNYKLVTGLDSGMSYYFCIKTFDECGNCSDFSNSPLITIEENYGDFLPGDANGDGDLLGSDVTYLVYYFRGINPPPNPYFAGDANGDCLVIGADVTRLVGYFRGFAEPPVDGNCEEPVVALDE